MLGYTKCFLSDLFIYNYTKCFINCLFISNTTLLLKKVKKNDDEGV